MQIAVSNLTASCSTLVLKNFRHDYNAPFTNLPYTFEVFLKELKGAIDSFDNGTSLFHDEYLDDEWELGPYEFAVNEHAWVYATLTPSQGKTLGYLKELCFLEIGVPQFAGKSGNQVHFVVQPVANFLNNIKEKEKELASKSS